jgi:hypothetical protein
LDVNFSFSALGAQISDHMAQNKLQHKLPKACFSIPSATFNQSHLAYQRFGLNFLHLICRGVQGVLLIGGLHGIDRNLGKHWMGRINKVDDASQSRNMSSPY